MAHTSNIERTLCNVRIELIILQNTFVKNIIFEAFVRKKEV